jgi:hypothetical protein
MWNGRMVDLMDLVVVLQRFSLRTLQINIAILLFRSWVVVKCILSPNYASGRMVVWYYSAFWDKIPE